MGMAPVAHVVWNKFMTFNPKNPKWVNRDRFVLSYVLFCTFFFHIYNDRRGGLGYRAMVPEQLRLNLCISAATAEESTLIFDCSGTGD